jgi:fumarate hydratase, class I
MTTIKQKDFIESIADALQYISYYHPMDYITALGAAYEVEQSAAARDAIAQILTNSRMCAEGHRPICQDTGIVVVFLKVGMDVRWDAALSVDEMVNEGVRRAYLDPDNKLRASILSDPAGKRKNTGDNTPAVIHYEIVPGDKVDVLIAAKGGGSENKSKFTMLNPSDSIVDWVVKTVPTMGAGWCPPGMLGIGIGGSAEKAMVLAKEALMESIDMHELKQRGASNRLEELRLELYDKVNALGIGAQGLGGLSTVLDVKIKDYPTHAASLPVAMIPNCAATRHAHFVLDGSGPARLDPPDLSKWPKVEWAPAPSAKRVNLDVLTPAEVAAWQPGDRLLLSGKMLTGRDAAHKRMVDMLSKGEKLPVDFTNRVIYYVGPVDPVGGEVVGPAGPTTAIEAIKRHKAAYLMAVGGAAYLVSKAIRSSRVVAFKELGMEAIYEFEVKDMPVTVAVDANGTSVHNTGPEEWRKKIAIKVA